MMWQPWVYVNTDAHLSLQYVHHSELRHWQFRRIDHNGSHKPVSALRDTGEWDHEGYNGRGGAFP